MKNYIFLLLLSLITLNSFAQEFQGKAFYISKTKMDPNFGKNMPPERKQRIMERLKSNLEKATNWILTVLPPYFMKKKDWMFLVGMGVSILCLL